MTDPSSTHLLSSPAAGRNRVPILAVLSRILPERGTILEIASGSGEHAVFFAKALPNITWQPTDLDPAALRSIAARVAMADLINLAPPLALDAAATMWPVRRADAIVAINVVHISAWRTTEGLMSGAERVLGPGGVLYLYGPYKENGAHTAPSNAAFDESLRSRNPEWGVRDVAELSDVAQRHGLTLSERLPMPANNMSLIFHRAQ